MEELIWTYIDGEMSPTDRLSFEEQLKIDTALAQQYKQLSTINLDLESMSPRLASPHLIHNTMNIIEPSTPTEINKLPIYLLGMFLLASFGLIVANSSDQGSFFAANIGLSSYSSWFYFLENVNLSFFMNSFMIAIFAIPIVISIDIWMSRNSIDFHSLRIL